jgi:hypothetical protein
LGKSSSNFLLNDNRVDSLIKLLISKENEKPSYTEILNRQCRILKILSNHCKNNTIKSEELSSFLLSHMYDLKDPQIECLDVLQPILHVQPDMLESVVNKQVKIKLMKNCIFWKTIDENCETREKDPFLFTHLLGHCPKDDKEPTLRCIKNTNKIEHNMNLATRQSFKYEKQVCQLIKMI